MCIWNNNTIHFRRFTMAIPKEILSVERPKGTVVKHSGNKYYVIKRTSRYDNGRRVPVDLGIVGEIKDGKYVPKQRKLDGYEVDVKDYGNIEFCNECGKDLLNDLYKYYHVDDAKKIYAYSLIKAAYGNVTERDMGMRYDTSFISEYYPRVGCSRKTVGEFYELLGRRVNLINKFMKDRLDAIDPSAYCIVDGMLKNNNAEINSYSEYSRKGKVKGSEDITLLYAIDYLKKEPLACSVYPGNMLDKTCFKDFSKKFDIRKGVMIGDKGIELNDEQRKEIAQYADFKYLIPIKRSLKCIKENDLLNYDDVIHTQDGAVLCKKVKIDDTKYYYSFLNPYLQGSEAQGYVTRGESKLSKKNTKEQLLKKYNDKKDSFGTIVFESNMDTGCEDAYIMYSYRWSIEEVFKYYKHVLDSDNVRVQSDVRVYGSEFINFLASIIICRVKNKIEQLGLSKKYSHKQILQYLRKVKKCRDLSVPDKWYNTTVLKYIEELVDTLQIQV